MLLHLQEQKAEYDGTDNTDRRRPLLVGFKNMLHDTLAYFAFHDQNHQLTPTTTLHSDRPMTLYKGPNSLFRALAPHYRLNKAEFLQIYNLKPTTQVELQLIIEESHTRFTEEQLDEMLALIKQVFEEDEAEIPAGVEDQEMEKVANKLLGASKKRRKGAAKKG